MILIREIKAEDTYLIRKSILRKGMTLSHKMKGDHEEDTLHLGLFDAGELVCIGSFMNASKETLTGSQFQLRGMATAEMAQGKGYGKLLLKDAELRLAQGGIGLIWCNARTIALNFYKKMGYETMGNSFEVDQVGPHFLMFKKLN